MKSRWLLFLAAWFGGLHAMAGEFSFQDDFSNGLGDGWSWIREHREAWRIMNHALEVRVEPGNMWGKANDAKNVLVRPAPVATNGTVEVTVTFENHPTNQYEQADLVWYYDDGHMVKIGEELVDGKLSVVMGREENDKTRTIKIAPLNQSVVTLRLTVHGNQIRGEFRPGSVAKWETAGECDLPAPAGAPPKVSLQFYQGAPGVEHWARATEFSIRLKTKS